MEKKCGAGDRDRTGDIQLGNLPDERGSMVQEVRKGKKIKVHCPKLPFLHFLK